MVRTASELVGPTEIPTAEPKRPRTTRRVLTILLLGFAGTMSLADPPETPVSGAADPTLPSVTVEAQREREQLRHQIETYVSRVVVKSFDESLSRWDTPICPLVAGLSRDLGEFMLTRLSSIVLAAQAPLDKSPDCHANFFVIVTSTPDVLLKKWRARNPAMFNDARGVAELNRFLEATRPVRVWYNADWGSATGGSALSLVGGLGVESPGNGAPTTRHYDGGTKLAHSAVRQIGSVIIVVDGTRLKNVAIGPLTDYIGMVGLADVHADADVRPARTILQLFSDSSGEAPMEMSDWDRALLKALYTTDQNNVLQLSSMKTSIMEAIAP